VSILRSIGGFTLIEVLVSLAIFALAAVALGAAYCNTLENIHLADRVQEQAGDLRTVRSLLLSEPDRRRAERGGDLLLPNGKRLHWTAEINAAQVADLFRITLYYENTHDNAGLDWKRTESFMLLRPSWSDEDSRDKLRAEDRVRLERGGPQ
jgi:general secretion pathway protein I